MHSTADSGPGSARCTRCMAIAGKHMQHDQGQTSVLMWTWLLLVKGERCHADDAAGALTWADVLAEHQNHQVSDLPDHRHYCQAPILLRCSPHFPSHYKPAPSVAASVPVYHDYQETLDCQLHDHPDAYAAAECYPTSSYCCCQLTIDMHPLMTHLLSCLRLCYKALLHELWHRWAENFCKVLSLSGLTALHCPR